MANPQEFDYPLEWPGDYPELVRPQSREVALNKNLVLHDLDEPQSQLRAIKYLAEQVYKSIKKLTGHHQYKLMDMHKLFGLADSLVPEDISHGGRMVPTIYEVFSVIKDEMFTVEGCRHVLVMGDSSDAILLANLAHAQISSTSIQWRALREYIGYEGTLRNYEHHADAAFALKPEYCLTVDVINHNISDAADKVEASFHNGVDILFLNATGMEVLENAVSPDLYATAFRARDWIISGIKLCHRNLKKGGNLVVRANVVVLTRRDCVLALYELQGLFEKVRLIAPALGADFGIIYIYLEGFFGIQSDTRMSNVCKGHNEVTDYHFVMPELFGFIQNLTSFICDSVVAHVLYLDSIISLVNMSSVKLRDLSRQLQALRDETPSYKPTPLDGIAQQIRDILGDCRTTLSVYLNWHNNQVMPNEDGFTPPPFFEQIEEDKRSIHVDVYRAIRVAKANTNDGLGVVRDLLKLRMESWDHKIRYIDLGTACVIMDWLDSFNPTPHAKYEVIWGSRWCLSSLVPLRGVFKTIMMNVRGNLNLSKYIHTCSNCRIFSDSTMTLINTLANKISGTVTCPDFHEVRRQFSSNKKSFVFECFTEDFGSFASKSDLECAHNRALKMMGFIEKLPNHGSMYICGYPMLSRLDVGTIYYLTTIFKSVYLVGCNYKPVTFGIFFYDLLDKDIMKQVIMRHIYECVESGQSEMTDFEDIDFFFAFSYLNHWNSHVIGHAIKMQERNYSETT